MKTAWADMGKGSVAGALRTWRSVLLVSALALWSASLAHGLPRPQTKAPDSAEVPVLKAGAGPCSADFTVRDTSGKGVYDAKITLQVQYGFLGVRKLDLNIGTNYEGKARIEGLPDKTKRAADFKITHGSDSKAVPYDPYSACSAQHEVVLGDAGTPGEVK
jgi:hypothetical protein